MKKIASLAAVALLAYSGTSLAQGAASCDAIRAMIDAKVRAGGVNDFTLSVLDAEAPSGGRVVGSCELGTKKIVYERSASTSAAAPSAAPLSRQPPRSVITECKDGFVNVGGECRPKP